MNLPPHVAAVTTREELIYLLSRASELEHGLACVYLFAAYSLKGDVAEGGLTEADVALVRGWKRSLAKVAIEEMLHLGQVANMLTAIGGAPHLRRTNFPLPATAFPFGLRLALEPFSHELIERFVCYEMPEAGVLTAEQDAVYAPIRERVRAAELAAAGEPARAAAEPANDEGGAPLAAEAVAGCEPFDVDFTTVGEFYHKIESGFHAIPEDELFIGPPEAQADPSALDFGGAMRRVTDTASACAAIEMIVEQGEAPSQAHPDAHFVVFDRIRTEYEHAVEAARRDGRRFEPVRPVTANPMTRYYDDTSGGTVIADPVTHEVAEVFNMAYDTMLLVLLRFFAHTEEDEAERALLARAALRAMAIVLRPLGEALTKLPMGAGAAPGATAGPGFGYNRDVHLLPHKRSAWVFFGERLRDLALRAARLRARPGMPPEIGEAAAALEDLAIRFAPADRPWNPAAEQAAFAALENRAALGIAPEHDGPYLVTGIETLLNSRGEALAARPAMALCRCGGSANKPFCDGTHARIGFSSAKLDGRVPDRLDRYQGDGVIVEDNRGICQHSGFCTDELPAVFHVHNEPFVDPNGADAERIVAQVRRCPSGALHAVRAKVREGDGGGERRITVSKDGPYRVAGAVPLAEAELAAGQTPDHYALCRCGGSKNKPFCDGTHWYNGFTDERN